MLVIASFRDWLWLICRLASHAADFRVGASPASRCSPVDPRTVPRHGDVRVSDSDRRFCARFDCRLTRRSLRLWGEREQPRAGNVYPLRRACKGEVKVLRDRATLAHAKRLSPEADVEEHVRLAIYSVKRGTAEEVGEIARGGMLPILRKQPGFVRYGLVLLDDGSLASVSVWETHDEAEAANASTADFVAESLADRVELQNRHTGDFLFDEGA